MIKPQLIAIGIVFNQQRNQVYITQRLPHCDEGNLWEFAGGKVEENETILQGLTRELQEELDIELITAEHFETIILPNKNKQLFFYTVYTYKGQPKAQQAAQGRWIELSKLIDYSFPEANLTIVQKLNPDYKN